MAAPQRLPATACRYKVADSREALSSMDCWNYAGSGIVNLELDVRLEGDFPPARAWWLDFGWRALRLEIRKP